MKIALGFLARYGQCIDVYYISADLIHVQAYQTFLNGGLTVSRVINIVKFLDM